MNRNDRTHPIGTPLRHAEFGLVRYWRLADELGPDVHADGDDIATTVAGSPEERAAQVIDQLVADGTVVDPESVRVWQDPDDPDHLIVTVDDEY